jgi:serine protease Do
VDVAQAPAARSAIQAGDVIVAVNQTRFSSIDEFTKLIGEQQKGAKVALLVRRGEASIYVPVEVG